MGKTNCKVGLGMWQNPRYTEQMDFALARIIGSVGSAHTPQPAPWREETVGRERSPEAKERGSRGSHVGGCLFVWGSVPFRCVVLFISGVSFCSRRMPYFLGGIAIQGPKAAKQNMFHAPWRSALEDTQECVCNKPHTKPVGPWSRETKWLWVKNMLKPAVPWWFNFDPYPRGSEPVTPTSFAFQIGKVHRGPFNLATLCKGRSEQYKLGPPVERFE